MPKFRSLWRRVRSTSRFALLLGLLVSLVAVPCTEASATSPSAGISIGVGAFGEATLMVPFPSLGLPATVSFSAPDASQGFQIPVPQALNASVLTGTLELPSNLGSGYVNVISGDISLGSVNLPGIGSNVTSEPFSVPLTDAKPIGGVLSISLVLRQNQALTNCTSNQSLVLVNPQVTFTGHALPPTTVADFYPSVLSTLDVYVAQPETVAEESAVLQAMSAITYRYSPQPLAINVLPWVPANGLPTAPPVDQFERALVVEQSGKTGVSVEPDASGNLEMVMSGSATTLPLQTAVLTQGLAELAQSNRATILRTRSVPTISGNEKTFSQLGIGGSVTGSGQQAINVAIDEGQLGGPAKSYTINLQAHYTPVAQGEKATVVESVNQDVLGEAVLNSSGVLSQNLTVPQPLITRTTTLQLQMTYFTTGGSGACGANIRQMSLTIDPQSTVSSTLVQGGIGGFYSTPAALLPAFQVAMDQNSIDRLSAAVSTVCDIQRLSSLLLQPMLVPLGTAENSDSPAIIVANTSAVQHAFDAPMQHVGSTVVQVNRSSSTIVNTHDPLGSIQVFADKHHGRTVVLVSTSGDWSLVSKLFSYLGNNTTTWSALTGDVLATGPSGQIVNAAILAGGPASSQFVSLASSNLVPSALLLSVILALVLVVGAWFVRRRLARKKG